MTHRWPPRECLHGNAVDFPPIMAVGVVKPIRVVAHCPDCGAVVEAEVVKEYLADSSQG